MKIIAAGLEIRDHIRYGYVATDIGCELFLLMVVGVVVCDPPMEMKSFV